jgi:alpha-tubulin suppressor-like RCC1 family protein
MSSMQNFKRLYSSHRWMAWLVTVMGGALLFLSLVDSPVQALGYPNPGQVTSLSNVTQVAGGLQHSLFRKSDGTVWAVGANGSGQLGDSTNTLRNSPVTMVNYDAATFQYVTFTGGAFVSASANTTVVTNTSNRVWTTGNNGRGQLGEGCGVTPSRNYLNKIGSFSSVTRVVGGSTSEHFIALKTDSTLWAWGRNDYGQLGDGTNTDRCPPVVVVDSMYVPITGFSGPAAGGFHSLAIKSDSMGVARAWTWGDNVFGQLGR